FEPPFSNYALERSRDEDLLSCNQEDFLADLRTNPEQRPLDQLHDGGTVTHMATELARKTTSLGGPSDAFAGREISVRIADRCRHEINLEPGAFDHPSHGAKVENVKIPRRFEAAPMPPIQAMSPAIRVWRDHN